MSQVERKYMKSVDDVILNASPDVLKKIQELDIQTQLNGNSFYDELASSDSKTKDLSVDLPSQKKTK